jgi:glycyl-tRNA synthetase
VELKRNIMNEWWRDMVHSREDIVGIDASIIMHPRVWEVSGHLAGFNDPLVDCKVCKERFRADRAPTAEPGTEATITLADKGRAKTAVEVIEREFGDKLERRGKAIEGAKVGAQGYVCPNCGSPYLSDERLFNLMFRSSIGSVDPAEEIAAAVEKGDLAGSGRALRERLSEIIKRTAVYLRPETAQAMFVQFDNVLNSTSMKVPFGIAQMGKSFRNEVTVEHYVFRSCEFEQMEMEYFVEPGTDDRWMQYWKDERMAWWRRYANEPDNFRFREHGAEELAHYAKECYDIEFRFPWGWDELEGVANRTDYDLSKHAEASGKKLEVIDAQRPDPATGKPPLRFVPYVIEPAAGATRGALAYLLDALDEDEAPDAKGKLTRRTVLRLHPRLAPFKAAILPLVKKDGMPEKAREIARQFFEAGLNAKYDEQHAIGRRYRRHDEVGTPYALTVDGQTLADDTVTIRDRDTMKQDRISVAEALAEVERRLRL